MPDHPSGRRYVVVGVTSLAALWMYVDRVCLSTLADRIQRDLAFDGGDKAWILGAFFLAYALCQLPAGSLADRFGQRAVLTGCIAAWSLVTMLTGFVQGFVGLFLVRLLLGVAEAGAYPAAAGLVKNWAKPTERGRFSSFVSLGGRGGGAVAPYLTALLAVAFVGWGPAYWTVEQTTVTVDNGTETATTEVLNWRAVFVCFGLCGLLVALFFWLVVRDRPAATAGPSGPPQRPLAERIAVLIESRNMILFAVVQFAINVGWAPLVTLLPTYLGEVFGTPLKQIGDMQSTVLLIGCVGMLLGGYVTDALHRRLGPRWGRSVPVGVATAGCVACCLVVPHANSAWNAILILGAMAFLVDLGNPSIWAFAQDVGGRTVGAALGWGNMFGNLGAFASPIVLTAVKDRFGWDAAFFACAGCFAVAAACGFLLNAGQVLKESRND